MIKHIVIWNFKDEISASERKAYAAQIKTGLESLVGKINGLVEIKVQIDFLDSSNGDIMLDADFTDEASLKGYQTDPEHLKTARIVRDVTGSRKCVDYKY